jgi:hypothetical protein
MFGMFGCAHSSTYIVVRYLAVVVVVVEKIDLDGHEKKPTWGQGGCARESCHARRWTTGCVCSFSFSFSLPFSFPARVGQMHAIKSPGDGDEIPGC